MLQRVFWGESPDRWRKDDFQMNETFKVLYPIPSWLTMLLYDTCFQGYFKVGDYNSTKLGIFMEIWAFCLKKCSPNCCKLLVTFQDPERWFWNFRQFSCCFYKGESRGFFLFVLNVTQFHLTNLDLCSILVLAAVQLNMNYYLWKCTLWTGK